MPSSNYDYWREREELQRQHNISELDEYNAKVAAIYQMMIDMAIQEINAFYGKYASVEGITIQEAKARISKLDIEEYARKAAEYVKNHDLSESANAEMRLYNATMKINRLELLKANIGLYMCGGFSEIEKMTGMKLDEATMAEFERLAGILGKTINNADKRVDSLVNASFQNATYSDRIWMYQDALKDRLSQLLTSGMIQGKSPAELARELRKEFDVSRHQSERLMRTELCRVQTEAQKLSYKNNGYRKYIYLALGANPCEDCLENDGQVFKVDEMSIAVNAPPMHPNCMCSTAPYFDEKENALVGVNDDVHSISEMRADIDHALKVFANNRSMSREQLTGLFKPRYELGIDKITAKKVYVENKDLSYFIKKHVTDGSLRIEDLKCLDQMLNYDLCAANGVNASSATTGLIYIKQLNERNGLYDAVVKTTEYGYEVFHFQYRSIKSAKKFIKKLLRDGLILDNVGNIDINQL